LGCRNLQEQFRETSYILNIYIKELKNIQPNNVFAMFTRKVNRTKKRKNSTGGGQTGLISNKAPCFQ